MSPLFLALLVAVVLLNLAPRLFRPLGKARAQISESRLDGVRLTEGLLHALTTIGGRFRADTRIVPFEETPTIERAGSVGRLVLIPIIAGAAEPAQMVARVVAEETRRSPAPLIVIVGGHASVAPPLLGAARPLRALHVDDRGVVREARASLRSPSPRLALELALDQVARSLDDGGLPYIDFETARALASRDPLPPPATAPLRMPVTFALTLAIALCFAVQVIASPDSLRGDGASLAIVYRMGGIYRQAILDGEWQRLIAAPFLHFGLVHILMNGWAQWALGGVVESLLGPWRFLILWVGSALGASLTSMAMNEATLAAGASGAVFGLLGAFTAFVFFRKDMLPQPVPSALRNGIWVTLLLNLFISFIPGVDMAAHIGGFVTGAILAMFVTRAPSVYEPRPGRGALLPTLAVMVVVFVGVGKTSIDENLAQVTRAPRIQSQYKVDELALPIPKGFVVSESGSNRMTTVMAETPASPFSVFYRITSEQRDPASAKERLEEMKPNAEPTPEDDDEVIALAWRGTLNLRGIEVLVQTPRSCREEAERLGSDLTSGIR